LEHPSSIKPTGRRTTWVEEALFLDGYGTGMLDLFNLILYVDEATKAKEQPDGSQN
jgi:hypothetical protein